MTTWGPQVVTAQGATNSEDGVQGLVPLALAGEQGEFLGGDMQYHNVAGSLPVDTDPTLAANSDGNLASQKATKSYVDNSIGNLGSAAFDNVGTGANEIVQLDGLAKLPAVDGSQLTNLPGVEFTEDAGNFALAVGNAATTSAQSNSTAFGVSSVASTNCVAIGDGAHAHTHSTVIGSGATTTGSDSVAIGLAAIAAANEVQLGDNGVQFSFKVGDGTGLIHGDASAMTNLPAATLASLGDITVDVPNENLLLSKPVGLNTGTAVNNTGAGIAALAGLTDGVNNTAVGDVASSQITTGSDNVAYGYAAGATVTTGSQSVAIGSGADVTGAAAVNQIAIGYGAIAPANNWAQIGNANVTNVAVGNGGTTFMHGTSTRVNTAITATIMTPTAIDTTQYATIKDVNGVDVNVAIVIPGT